MKKKAARRKKKTVLFKRSYLIYVGTVVLAFFFFLNPKPADFTLQNVYQKVAHTILHPQSEYLTDAYVADVNNQDGLYHGSDLAAIFDNNPAEDVANSPASNVIANVLPANIEQHVLAAADDSKWIEVDLSDQKIMAWENGEKKMEFAISSGKPWTPTPPGEYRIWIKLRYASMHGGSKEAGDYYYLPNVPYVMYFYKGYGIHGAYWHMNFGTPMSHGCVNMKPDEAGLLFNWAGPDMQGKSVMKSTDDNPGTRVVVHE